MQGEYCSEKCDRGDGGIADIALRRKVSEKAGAAKAVPDLADDTV